MDKIKFFFWAYLGNFWGSFWDQIGQRGGKMSPREPSGVSKSQKAAFSKTLKNLWFFSVFGSRGLPRESQEARESSQETPKETPKGGQKLVKKTSISAPKNEQKKVSACSRKIALTEAWLGVFEAMGPSKNAYFEQKKKTVPKWFKNGSRLPKLLKIAPKRRPYKDL